MYYNYNELIEITKKYNQSHLLKYWDSINSEEKSRLSEEIKNIDWTFIRSLSQTPKKDADIEPIDALSLDEINANRDAYMKKGLDSIKRGELCVLLLAGGQGTRLGYNKPKGVYNIGVTRDLYIFEILMKNTLDIVKKAGTWINFYIMTSNINNSETVSFFEEHNYFGYNPDYIHFFVQELNPCTDFEGKILMTSPYTFSQAPNGNGGWFSSLEKAGLLGKIFDSKIKWINVFSVDNVLQKIADPVFLGATIDRGFQCGAKVVKKVSPSEKVGAMCKLNGKPHIIEYYELSKAMREQKNADGSLSYGYGVILNYLFSIDKLVHTLKTNMPLHVVKKAIPYMNSNHELVTPTIPNGLKFETLALDLIHEMDDCLVFEVDRLKEFAPVKNKTGTDSVDTARELLKENGYTL